MCKKNSSILNERGWEGKSAKLSNQQESMKGDEKTENLIPLDSRLCSRIARATARWPLPNVVSVRMFPCRCASKGCYVSEVDISSSFHLNGFSREISVSIE